MSNEIQDEFEKFEKAVSLMGDLLSTLNMEVSTALTALSFLYIHTARDQAEMTEDELVEAVTKSIRVAYSGEDIDEESDEDKGGSQWLN